MVAAGLVLRLQAPRAGAAGSAAEEMTAFWSVIDELLNAMLFVLIGFELFAINFARVVVLPVVTALPLSLLSRLAGVALPALLLRGRGRQQAAWHRDADLGGLARRRLDRARADPAAEPVSWPAAGCMLRRRRVSMLLQGLTMPRVIRRLYGGTRDIA